MVVWRIEALETPAWTGVCGRCSAIRPFDAAGRFRVNAQGALHDVWLLYRCRDCGGTRKRRLFRRRRADALGPGGLGPYLGNDAATARRHAFELRSDAPLRYRVIAAPAPGDAYAVRIAQPEFCAIRWDRLLAAQLGWSRSRVARAWQAGRSGRRLRDAVRDGDRVRIRLDRPALEPS